MKLLIYSDLHLEFSDFAVPAGGYDVVVLAGDIHVGAQGVSWAKRTFTDVPVIYICGNHEYYHDEIGAVQREIREEAAGSNIHYCENTTEQFDGVRFVCATLWTDFALNDNPDSDKSLAEWRMNDYRLIQLDHRSLTPRDTEEFHWNSRQYLESEFAQCASVSTKTVVVTHHAPSQKSIRFRRISYDVAPAYASSLDDMIASSGATLWIHGHTHESVDYRVGDTRVYSNPRGYSYEPNGNGNPNFIENCIIEI